MDWEHLHQITGIIVDTIIVFGATVAAVKFRLFNVLGHRWRSEVESSHWELGDGSIIFSAEYTIHNTGQRTLQIQDVSMGLVPARVENSLLVPDEVKVLAEREMVSGDPRLRGIFHIAAGERTIFTLRCKLAQLDDVVFVMCRFNLGTKRIPAGFRGFYCRRQVSQSSVRPRDTQDKVASIPSLPLAS